MKAKNVLFGLAMLAMASCQQIAEEEVAESRDLVRFRVDATTLSYAEVADWEGGASAERVVSGESVGSRAKTEVASRVAFALIDEDGNKVISQEKGNDESGYKVLDVEVPVGEYQLVSFAHNGSESANISANAVVTPPGSKLTDSFIYYKVIELTEDSENESSITLDRCVAKVSIKHLDAIPSNTASVELVITGAGGTLDAKTGLAKDLSTQTVTINIPSSAVNTKENTFSAFLFLESEESTVDIVATTKTSTGSVLTSYTIEDVPVEVNMQTICSGTLFHAGQKMSVTINSDWKDDKEITF